MTTPTPVAVTTLQQPPAEPPVQADQHVILDIALILAAGLAAKKTLELVGKVLVPLGFSWHVIRLTWTVGHFGTSPGQVAGSVHSRLTAGTISRRAALNATLQGEATYRAAYLLAAARRLQAAAEAPLATAQSRTELLQAALRREQAFYQAHVAALKSRRRAAVQVDRVAVSDGTIGIDPQTGRTALMVGWHAKLDSRTDPICRAANGSNFVAARMPAIGWPGAVHGISCRCRAGRPFVNARVLP